MIVSQEKWGIYRFLLSAQRTSCSKPRGSPWSSLLRSDGSRDDQAEEAGPVEQGSAEAKSLKLRAEGLPGCHSSEQQPRQPDRGPEGQNKGLLSRHITKKRELKEALNWSTRRPKAACQRKAQWLKRKTLTLGFRICCCRKWCCRCWWRCRWVRTRRANLTSLWQRFGVWRLSPESGG
jgi:hypothetical protein